MDDRRVPDELFRRHLGERMVAMETTFKDHAMQVIAAIESLKKDMASMNMQVLDLHYTLYGGPKADNVGLLERFRLLLWKFSIATVVAFGIVGLFTKPVARMIDRVVEKGLGEDPMSIWEQQRTKKTLKHYNKTTGKWEYYIEFTPVGLDSPTGAKQPASAGQNMTQK